MLVGYSSRMRKTRRRTDATKGPPNHDLTSAAAKRARPRFHFRAALVDQDTHGVSVVKAGRFVSAGEIIESGLRGNARHLEFAFRFIIGLAKTPARVVALYRIASRSTRWLELDGSESICRYLNQAVFKAGADVAREWEMDGILDAEQATREREAAREMEKLRRRLRPHAPSRDALARLRPTLNDRQRAVLDVMDAEGCGAAEALRRLGLGWSVWQSLQRKAKRRLSA
jgi:hypothetical protein